MHRAGIARHLCPRSPFHAETAVGVMQYVRITRSSSFTVMCRRG